MSTHFMEVTKLVYNVILTRDWIKPEICSNCNVFKCLVCRSTVMLGIMLFKIPTDILV